MALKFKSVDNLRQQHSCIWRAGVEVEAGEEFFCRRGSTQGGSAFQHQDFAADLRQTCSRGQPVVAAPNHNDIVCLAHSPRSLRISMAARRPGAPVMPPPGWVAEPHW